MAGKLPWRDLFDPTIKLCEDGYKVSRELATMLHEKEDLIKNSSSLSELFINTRTNTVYKENDVLKRVKYANTLRNLSLNGYETFYKGAMTKLIVEEINQNGIWKI